MTVEFTGTEEIKVTNRKGHKFYQNACKSFFEGDEEKERKAHNCIILSAVGGAINVAIGVAAAMEREEVAFKHKIETKYISTGYRGNSPQMIITMIKKGVKPASVSMAPPVPSSPAKAWSQ